MRLQVYLSHSGVASRRAAEALITEGRVSVNGAIITEMGTKVSADDVICFDGKQIFLEKEKRYVLLYKPVGLVCSLSDEKGRAVAASLLKDAYKERLYNVGRLDMYSSGLILFTNDGIFSKIIEHPSAQIEKEYFVEASQNIPDEVLLSFGRGIRVEGVFYRCIESKRMSSSKVKITLIEGKNREIRRVFESFSIPVKKLIRIRVGSIELGELKSGEFRDLTESEKDDLLRLAKNNQTEDI